MGREPLGRGAANLCLLDHLGPLGQGKRAWKINKTGPLPKLQDQGL